MTNDRMAAARRLLLGAAALLLMCGSGFAAAAGKPNTYNVDISQMRYGALPDHLKVGDTIVWVNKDTVQHTVTAKDHSFDVRIPSGKRTPQVLKKAGTLPFYCIFHPTMRGTLKVAAG